MARRRGDDGTATLFAVGVLALAFIAPPIILVGWLVTEVRARMVGGEATEPARLVTAVAAARERVDALLQGGVDEGLEQRADGLFDARSRAGRSLNAQIAAAAATQEETSAALEATTAPLLQRAAMRVAVATWAVTAWWLWRSIEAYALSVASAVAIAAGALTYFWAKRRYDLPH